MYGRGRNILQGAQKGAHMKKSPSSLWSLPMLLPLRHVRRLSEKAHVLQHSELLKLVRYFVAGVAVSLGYTVTVLLLVEFRGWLRPELANVVSFLLWTPVSYVVHRDFTFRFDGELFISAFRFFVTFIAKLSASIVVVWLAIVFQVHYIFGIMTNWVVLPLITYLMLKLWVFGNRAIHLRVS
jgi:putative flippase GtrA